MLNINDLKDPEMPKKGASFRAVGCGMVDGKYVGTTYKKIVSQDTIYVPGSALKKCKPGEENDLQEVQIAFYTTIPEEKVVDGEKVLKGTIGDIVFRHGLIQVKPTDKRLYKYLYYSNGNRDNEHSNTPNKSFYEDKPALKLRAKSKEIDTMLEAVNFANKMEDSELMEFAYSINKVASDGDIETTRMMIKEFAQASPIDFQNLVASTSRRIKAIVNEAISLGLLENNTSTGEWNLIGKDKKRTILHRAPLGVNQMDWFVKELNKSNRNTDGMLANAIKEAKEGIQPVKVATKK